MDGFQGFTITSSQGVQIPVNLVLGADNASAKIEALIADLQKKCKLTLNIDTSSIQSATAAVANQMAKATRVTRGSTSGDENALLRRLQSFENARQKMQLRLGDLGNGKTTAEYERFVALLDQVRRNGGKGFEQLTSASIDAQHSIQNLNKELREAQSLAKLRQDLTNKLTPEWFSNQQGRLNTQFANVDPAMVTNVRAALEQLRQFGDVASLTDDQLKSCAAALEQYNRKVAEAGANNTFTKSAQDQATAIANLKAQYEDYMSKYGQNLSRNLPLLEKFRKFGADLSSGMSDNDATKRFAELREEAKKSGVEVETVRQRMNRLFGQHFNTALIMLAIRGLRMALRQLWQDIKEVNEALVQTQIVTGLSGAALEAYTDKAYAAAGKSKDKITNILSEATAYGRLGYDSELSVQLAQLTSMYSKLGAVETSEATDAITALMKAFDLKNADEIEAALDKMIYVGNNFPISAAGLGEGLNNAASALSAAGNSLEQTLALLMAANATVQNPAKSSTAMRTITARIRNTKAELDELGEELDEKYNTVAKYRQELLGLTGVDILDETGKNFRATYDILKDLADVWGTLNSTQQAAVTTMLAGTRQQDIFVSLMKNFPSAEEAMAGMDDAAGLMDEKFKAVEDSIGGSLSELSNAWSKFSNTLLNSGDVTAFIKMITGIVKALTSLTKVFGGGTLITGVLSLTILINKFRQFSQIYPQMQSVISTLNGTSGLHNMTLNQEQIQTAATALSGYTNAQQRLIMTQAGMSVNAQRQVLEFQGMSTAALGASGATSTLAASFDGLKAKLTAFVQSGNIWIMLLQAVTMIIMGVVNAVRQSNQAAEQAAEEAKQRAREAQQAARDSIKATKSAVDSLGAGGKSASDYKDRLIDLAGRLEVATEGSNDYKTAKLELYSVQNDIIEQFGAESGAIRGVTEDLRDYAERLDEVQSRSKYNSLFEGENYAGLQAALQLYGFTPEGERTKPSSTISISDMPLWVSFGADYWLGYIHNYDEKGAIEDALKSLLGEQVSQYLSGYETSEYRDRETHKESQNLLGALVGGYRGKVEEYVDVESLTFDGDIRRIIDLLEDRKNYLSQIGLSDWAAQISTIIGELKEKAGVPDAESIFNRWAEGMIKYGDAGDKLGSFYNAFVTSMSAYQEAIASGSRQDILLYFGEIMSAYTDFVDVAKDNGYEWAVLFIDGVVDGLSGEYGSATLLKDLSHGFLGTGKNLDGGWNYSPGEDDKLISTTDQLILRAGKMMSIEDARAEGLEYEYLLYDKLNAAAERYGVSIESILQLLSVLYGLPIDGATVTSGYSYSTFHNNAGSGLDVNDPFKNESALKATGGVASVKEASDELFDAEATRDRIADAFHSGAEIAQEDIDAIKEYVGDTFEEIDEDVLSSIDKTLAESREEISTSIEGLSNNAIKWMQDNADDFDIAQYIDPDSGEIDFSGIITAFNESGVENAAGAAGAKAALSYLSQLQTVGGASIAAKITDDGLGFVTQFTGGTGSTASNTPKRGGGGHHSHISDEIENVDRLIKLFRELLNYYDEGSEQWIARQRQIIDKYKAGVEIAMAEYDRLIKKGLKQTDDDVKKIVDTILEYQGDIFEESEKLWEAVRQNQIDSLKHLKDQNDAAITLEKTHHDLLLAIRNERRELEDELRAARNAYSETMTPEELDAMFSVDDYSELMDKLASIEGDAMSLYRDYKEQIAAVSEDETYMIEHITDEFKRQYDLKMKEYEIAKAELGVARAQQELENVKNEQTVMMLIGGRWQWVADPEKVLDAEQKLADAQQELSDAQDEYDFQSLIHTMEAQSSEYQRQIDALEALTFSMDELANQIHLFSDSVYKELLSYLSKIAQATFEKYEGDTAVPEFATGGVIRRGGLAVVHSGEPIFSTYDAEKLWRFVHDLDSTPINTDGVYSGLARRMFTADPTSFGGAQTVSIDNSINIPGGIHVSGEQAQQLIALLREVVAPYQPKI